MVYVIKSRHDLVILSIPLLILLELKKYTSNLCLMAAADIYNAVSSTYLFKQIIPACRPLSLLCSSRKVNSKNLLLVSSLKTTFADNQ